MIIISAWIGRPSAEMQRFAWGYRLVIDTSTLAPEPAGLPMAF